MKKTILMAAYILLGSLCLFAQNNESSCPQIEIVGPPAVIETGEDMKFSVSVNQAAAGSKLKYSWSIDRGSIINGQETERIVVATDGVDDTTITATVEIDGLPAGCQKTFSDTGVVVTGGHPSVFDEFGEIPGDDIRARIDAFLISLQNNPDAYGYIINYGSPEKIAAREKLIAGHVDFRRFPVSAIHFKDGGREDKIRTRLYILPAGVDPSILD
jgi:hypothetical protein